MNHIKMDILHPLALFVVLGGEESVQIDKGGWTDVFKSS